MPSFDSHTAAWLGFGIFMVLMLAIDLGLFHRKAHVVRFKEAVGWCIAWFTLSMIFGGLVWMKHSRGSEAALEFLTAYVLELSLSLDNVFVFLVIFTYFKVPAEYRHRILFWGIVGAVIMRGLFIWAGVGLINRFEWLLYVLGALLIYSAIKLAMSKGEGVDPEHNPVLRLSRKCLPIAKHSPFGRFFIREDGKLLVTPLFIVLLLIETTDVVFALDSIPAVLGVSRDPFIVFTSNMFAILGLRSLFFAIERFLGLFRYLHYGLALVLGFVGVKMMLSWKFHVPIPISLGIVGSILGISIIVSIIAARREGALAASAPAEDPSAPGDPQ